MEKLQPICLIDNVSSYLYNAFTFGKNNIFDGSKELDKVTKGVILGDPAFTIANSNVTVYPLYKPKTPRSNRSEERRVGKERRNRWSPQH